MTEEKNCGHIPPMMAGNRPADGGHLLIDTREEYEDFIKREPKTKKFIKRFMGGREFINNIERWCLWLVDATPQELHDMPEVMKRINLCKQDRLKGAPDRQTLAATPWLFRDTMNPKNYIAVPKTSSEKRYYIPMGYLDDSVIPSDGLHIVPEGSLYHFGVLTSRVHMAWVRRVAGRLEVSYRYSNTLVYNNFPWPAVDSKDRQRITATAQKILDARALYPDSSFAALYDDSIMPKELRKAHNENDIAVCEAYGWNKNISEEDILENLFELYQWYLAWQESRKQRVNR